MNWIEAGNGIMLNLENVRAILRETDYETRVFVSDNESFLVPIQYEALSSLIRMKSRDDSSSDIQRSLRTLAHGQFTPVP